MPPRTVRARLSMGILATPATLVELDANDSPSNPYWACRLCDAKGQPEFFAAAATSSAADHLRKYVTCEASSA